MKTKQRVRLLDTHKVHLVGARYIPRRFDVGTVVGFEADGTPKVLFDGAPDTLQVQRDGLEAAEKLGERLWNEIAELLDFEYHEEREDIIERLLKAAGISAAQDPS